MNTNANHKHLVPALHRAFFYGWIVVAACTLIQLTQFGVQYSFGVFFKPLIADFYWSRAATSLVYSILMICAGLSAIPLGWLADRFGPAKITVVCGVILGLALVLASQVRELWQLYLTFGVLLGISVGGTMAITSGITTRWFVKKRGMALGIVSAGIGIGTLVMPPLTERLITGFGWSQAYLIIGVATSIITIGSGLLLRREPSVMGLRPYGVPAVPIPPTAGFPSPDRANLSRGLNLREAARTRPFWLICILYFFVNICVQVIMVHLVNYATDLGIAALTAATLVSMIGIGGIIGRLGMGSIADRIGSFNSLIITCILLAVSLVWLIFSRELWMLYTFAVLFGFAYGEVPQMPIMVGHFFGLHSVMALAGAMSAATRAGGSLGSWLGGKIFDVSQSYSTAFIMMVIVAFLALATALVLKKVKFKGFS
jgi:OFA family oxalate/formate antiporter-like MFS transporter